MLAVPQNHEEYRRFWTVTKSFRYRKDNSHFKVFESGLGVSIMVYWEGLGLEAV